MRITDTTALPDRRKILLLATTGYLAFIVYGSLMPLDFNPRSLDAAWRDFLGVRYFVLGVESRADWVANLLLYMPLAYLLSAVTAAPGRPVAQLLLSAGVFLLCTALALAVEFTQLFFPPRTVSINDIGAEIVGTALGIAVWRVWGGSMKRLGTEMERGGPVALRAAAVVYALAYLALSLYPYDFYISAQEFSQKFASGKYGLLVAPVTCERMSICISRLGAEIIAVIPLGILFSMALGKAARRAYAKAACCGGALGLVIEVLQLFIGSGVSQGVSLLTRAVGMCLGVVLHRHVRWQWLRAAQPLLVPAVLAASVPYVFALMWYNGLFRGSWVGPDEVRESLAQVRWLPFYYHYFTSETAAVVSLLANVAMYLPVGVGCWLWQFARVQRGESASIVIPAVIAAVLAAAVETGKLFVGKHPDPTDVLIGATSAVLVYLVMRLLFRWSTETADVPAVVADPRVVVTRRVESPSASARPYGVTGLFAAVLLLAGVGTAIAIYPLPGPWLFIALAGYGLLLWRSPSIALLAVLALLPLLDFGQWTGWILVNEFDLLMGVTCAVLLLKRRTQPEDSQPQYRMSRMAVPLAASFLISAAIGLFPLQAFDSNAMSGYWTNYNSLRTLKGFLWAWTLLPLAARHAGSQARFQERIVSGMVIGLCAAALIIVWERLIFTGLFNFSNDYRAIGSFPELHTGGGDVHAYLVMAIAFIAPWVLQRAGIVRVAAGVGLFALASYALAVTFARGGYIGFCGAILLVGIALTIHGMRQRAWKVRRIALAGVLALAGLAVVAPIVMGPFMQARFSSVRGDADARMRHWTRAIGTMDGQLSTTLFGMGLGSYQRTFLLMARDDATATFSYTQEGGNGFVRLGSGKPLYFSQRVSIEAGKSYALAVDLRSSRPNTVLNASICEKSEQNSFQCKEMGLKVAENGPNWQHQEVKFDSDNIGLGLGRLHLRRPVFLSFNNSEQAVLIDVDNVRLVDASNRDLIANGDFSRGGARWVFAADDHAAWHIDNLWVEILFEQGWLGVLIFAVVTGMSLARLTRRVWKGGVFAGTLLAAISGLLLISPTESIFDGPRVTTLFFLLLFLGLQRSENDAPSGGRAARRAR